MRRNNVSDAIKYLHENERLLKEVIFYREKLQVKMASWVLLEVAIDILNSGGIAYKNVESLRKALRRYCDNPAHGVITGYFETIFCSQKFICTFRSVMSKREIIANFQKGNWVIV